MGSSDGRLNFFRFDDTPGSPADLNIVTVDDLFRILNRVPIGAAIDAFVRTLNASILVKAIDSTVRHNALLKRAAAARSNQMSATLRW